jgi:hypothetical protein
MARGFFARFIQYLIEPSDIARAPVGDDDFPLSPPEPSADAPPLFAFPLSDFVKVHGAGFVFRL